jgi:dipeptidase D
MIQDENNLEGIKTIIESTISEDEKRFSEENKVIYEIKKIEEGDNFIIDPNIQKELLNFINIIQNGVLSMNELFNNEVVKTSISFSNIQTLNEDIFILINVRSYDMIETHETVDYVESLLSILTKNITKVYHYDSWKQNIINSELIELSKKKYFEIFNHYPSIKPVNINNYLVTLWIRTYCFK